MNWANLNILPAITNISFSGQVLSYRLETTWAYVRCFVYDESSGLLIGRPVWDKQRTADQNYTAVVDTSVMSGPAIARFYAWRPDGGASAVTEYRICNCPYQGDLDTNGVINALDVTAIVNVVFKGAPNVQDASCPIKRADFNGDGVTNIQDVMLLVNTVFKAGPPPCNPCNETCPRP